MAYRRVKPSASPLPRLAEDKCVEGCTARGEHTRIAHTPHAATQGTPGQLLTSTAASGVLRAGSRLAGSQTRSSCGCVCMHGWQGTNCDVPSGTAAPAISSAPAAAASRHRAPAAGGAAAAARGDAFHRAAREAQRLARAGDGARHRARGEREQPRRGGGARAGARRRIAQVAGLRHLLSRCRRAHAMEGRSQVPYAQFGGQAACVSCDVVCARTVDEIRQRMKLRAQRIECESTVASST
eukprot:1315999-Prymnesium_polylepis.3